MTILHYRSYRDVILQKVKEHSSVRGYRSRLADVLGIQRSYYSQIINGSADLTPDHASLLSDFWRLDPAESEYFITLVNWERATTASLKDRLEKSLDKLRGSFSTEAFANYERRLTDPELAVEYFSSWAAVAVHASLWIEGINAIEILSSRLSIPRDQVKEALNLLMKIGIVDCENEIYSPNRSFMIKPPTRTIFAMHREEMHKKGAELYRAGDTDSIFYAGLLVMSRTLYDQLREEFRKQISQIAPRVRPEPCEEVAVLSIELFKVGKSI